MSKKLVELITLAKEQNGYIEKASNSNLDSKTANKGTANYTKYARDVNNAGLMGCQGQPWCCTLQFWLDLKTFGLNTALKLWNMSKVNYSGYNCFATYNAFKKAGKVGIAPRLGAIVIFTFSHAGRVIDIYTKNGVKYIACFEGNTSSNVNDRNGGQVKIKERLANDPTIKGYCYIDYNQFETTNTPSYVSTPISTSTKGLLVTADSLNIRKVPNPDGDKTGDVYAKNTAVIVKAKAFINQSPWFQVEDGNWISAKYLKGWVKENNRWWYLLPGYTWYMDKIVEIDGYEYGFGNDGYMLTGWIKSNDKWMYSNSDGVILKRQWVNHTDGKQYYIMADGFMAANAYVKSVDKNLYYRVNKDGVWEPKWNTVTPDLDKYKLVV